MRTQPDRNLDEDLTRRDVDPAALALLERHGGQILATARRYSANVEDAEDAFQRAFEILLTNAPEASGRSLVPWLKTVVKNEALSIRIERDRHSPLTTDGAPADVPTTVTLTHDQAEHRERLSQGAEALGQLKPQEVRALVLRASGYSYREICELTGWTYTKTNRAMSEGRRAFTRRVEGIQAGAECERLAPRLSALADGEACVDDLAALRPHLRTCLACRARLKEFRAAPSRVAALMPPAALVAAGAGAPDGGGGTLRELMESIVAAIQHKTAAMGERAHAAVELATGQKAAAVAASAAALAGGGTAMEQIAGPAEQPAAADVPARTVAEKAPVTTPVETVITQTTTPTATTPADPPAAAPEPEPDQPAPDPADEFSPAGAGATSAATAQHAGAQQAPGGQQAATSPATQVPDAQPLATTAPAPAAAGRGGPAGSGEFAP